MNAPLFVIGSNSISGASFIAGALRAGRQVVGVSRSQELHECFLPYRWLTAPQQENYRFQQCDLNHDTDGIVALWQENGAGTIVNFAAQSMVAESWLHPEHWYQTNVVANVRLHEALRKTGNLQKYVHVSTPEVYGTCSGTVTENEDYRPSTPYAASRAACDLHLMTFYKQYGFPVCFTRAANVYGAGQQLYRIIPRTILAVLTGEKLQLHGGGHSVRSFIHLDDVADATLRIANEGKPGEIYHLSTDRFVSIRELVEMVCKQMRTPFHSIVEVTEDRPGKDAAYLLDSAKCRKKLGWQDRVSLEKGIASVITWAETWRDTLTEMPLAYQHKP